MFFHMMSQKPSIEATKAICCPKSEYGIDIDIMLLLYLRTHCMKSLVVSKMQAGPTIGV